MLTFSSAASRARRVLLVEDDYLQASEMCLQLGRLGISVVGPVATVDAALQRIAGNEVLEGAILDLCLGDEWAYPLATKLSCAGVPFVFWTGYDGLALPHEHESVPLVSKTASGRELVRALFEPSADAAPRVFAELFATPDGETLLIIPASRTDLRDPALRWIGATMLDRAVWSRRLRLPLSEGIFYRIPPRYSTALRVQLDLIG